MEMELGFPGRPKVPREALATVVPGTTDEIEMEPRFPGLPKVPREALATGVPGTTDEIEMEPRFPGLPKGKAEAGKALDTERKPGIGRPTNCFTGRPTNCKLLDFSTPRRDKVAGFCGSIRYDTRQGETINIQSVRSRP
jgi:hypothetical protein